MNMKKKLCIILACVFIITLMAVTAGCRKNQDVNENTPGEANTPAADRVTLSVVTTIGENDSKRAAYEAAYRAWETETGNSVSEIYGTANENLTDDLHSSFEDGDEPDVMYYFSGREADALVNDGKVVPLSEIITEYPGFAGEHDLRLIPTSTADGVAYAVPLYGHWELMYANKTVLAECGIALPDENTTFEEFIDMCEVIKEHGYVPLAVSLSDAPDYLLEYAVFNHSGIENHRTTPKFAEAGNQDENQNDNENANQNQDENENVNQNQNENENMNQNENQNGNVFNTAGANWIAGIEDVRFLYERGFLPENTMTMTEAEAFSLMYDDRAAFAVDGSWKISEIELEAENPDNFTVCFVPGTDIRKSSDIIAGLSSGWYITSKAWDDPERRAAAVSFVQKMVSRETIASYDGVEGMAVTLNGGPIAPENPSELRSDSINVLSAMTGSASPTRELIDEERRGAFFTDTGYVMTNDITSEQAVRDAFTAR